MDKISLTIIYWRSDVRCQITNEGQIEVRYFSDDCLFFVIICLCHSRRHSFWNCIEQIWYREWYMTWKDKPRPFVMWEWKIVFGYKNYHIGRYCFKNSHFSITTSSVLYNMGITNLAKYIRTRNPNMKPGSLTWYVLQKKIHVGM